MERKEIQLLVISLSIVFFTLLVLILVLFFYFHKKKTNFLIEKMEADLHFQSELVKSRIEMKDQTLTEISRELHDNIGQILSVAIMQVNMYIQNQKAMTKDELNDLKDILGKSLDEIRTLSRIINRDNLLESSFLEAIQLDLERIQKLKRIDCYFSINGDFPEINVEHELIIYRIFQEAILNILKHSHSEIIDFQIDCLDHDNIKIKLIDHGIGFNSKKKSSGSGLNNIHVRAKLIGALVSITSDSSGTVVLFTYPKRINHENE